MSICASLTPFGVASRYPGGQDIDETITTTNIVRAQQIYDFCLAKIPEEGRPIAAGATVSRTENRL
jgi:hypothetical protein